MTLSMRFYLAYENKRRDERVLRENLGASTLEKEMESFYDLTDKENVHFRYVY